jgi:hypothetical protein
MNENNIKLTTISGKNNRYQIKKMLLRNNVSELLSSIEEEDIEYPKPGDSSKSKSNKKLSLNNVIIKERTMLKKWNLDVEDDIYNSDVQYGILFDPEYVVINKDELHNIIIQEIKNKIYNYHHQDVLKKIYNPEEFITFEYIIDKIKNSNLLCCYCNNNILILYNLVREMKQWSIDRINNDLGHNINNIVISCLECNLKRRKMSKDKFEYTKNLTLVKLTKPEETTQQPEPEITKENSFL